MAEIIGPFLNKRRNRSSDFTDDTVPSPETKKSRQDDSLESAEGDEVLTALKMSEKLGAKIELILQKLTKLDTIEASVKNMDYKS